MNKNIFFNFQNNVFCRRDHNQMKAKKIWEEIKLYLDKSDCNLFQIEWSHYLMGELDPKEFGIFYNKYIKKYYE